MELRLDGQRVVITAAVAGIGRATLETFVAAGARVFVCDVDEAGLSDLRGALPEVGTIVGRRLGSGCRGHVCSTRRSASSAASTS